MPDSDPSVLEKNPALLSQLQALAGLRPGEKLHVEADGRMAPDRTSSGYARFMRGDSRVHTVTALQAFAVKLIACAVDFTEERETRTHTHPDHQAHAHAWQKAVPDAITSLRTLEATYTASGDAVGTASAIDAVMKAVTLCGKLFAAIDGASGSVRDSGPDSDPDPEQDAGVGVGAGDTPVALADVAVAGSQQTVQTVQTVHTCPRCFFSGVHRVVKFPDGVCEGTSEDAVDVEPPPARYSRGTEDDRRKRRENRHHRHRKEGRDNGGSSVKDPAEGAAKEEVLPAGQDGCLSLSGLGTLTRATPSRSTSGESTTRVGSALSASFGHSSPVIPSVFSQPRLRVVLDLDQ